MADDSSRELLKKKVIDRWENEGGKLSGEGIKTPESGSSRKPKKKNNAQPLSQEGPARENDSGSRKYIFVAQKR